MWSEKYRPKRVSEMIGNEESRGKLVGWLSEWRRGAKPMLLVGPPGTGKTTIANLVSVQFGYDVIGLNASDARSKAKIEQVLKPVLGNAGIFGSSLIFIDEVDGIHGRADFGGAGALAAILKNPAVPIILAANSDASDKMKAIKKGVTTVYFKKLPPRLLRAYLRGIVKREGADLGPGATINAINGSRGDIRSMMNVAQALATGFVPDMSKSEVSLDAVDGVTAFFAAEDRSAARRVLYSMGAGPREKIGAFYSSIVMAKLDPNTRSAMLQAVSDADMLYGRIMKTQQWRLLRYLDETLLRAYRKGSGIGYSKYNLPFPALNRIMWHGKNLQKVSGILADATHMSRSDAASICLPYVTSMVNGGTLDIGLEEPLKSALRKEAKP